MGRSINYKYYNLLIKTRLKNRRTVFGKEYFVNTYIITVINTKANITSLTKKKGTN